jgi:uncharacterized protein YbbC (DUF1343 family)
MKKVQTGLDVLLKEDLHIVKDRKIGFVTNHSAVTSDLTPAVDALIATGVGITTLFGPEHGVRGEFADGEEISSSTDPRTGLVTFSLYGAQKKPTPEMLSNVDLLLFDIQDVGSRFYTYLYTMTYAMQACAENGKQFIVLDRPNPIGGIAVEGPVLDRRFSSFVGLYPIPIRYGMTIGELARLFNAEFDINAELMVIPLRGWKREMWFEDTGLPWIPTSPAMPTIDTALVYPGACLLEGTNISEGRGTTQPFLTLGAPWIDGLVLAKELNSAGLSGVHFRPTHFIPSASKYNGLSCSGVALHVTERDDFLPVLTGVKIIETIRRLWPEDFTFREPGQDGRSFFDLLAGTDRIRLGLEADVSSDELAAEWTEDVSKFMSLRSGYLLYP